MNMKTQQDLDVKERIQLSTAQRAAITTAILLPFLAFAAFWGVQRLWVKKISVFPATVQSGGVVEHMDAFSMKAAEKVVVQTINTTVSQNRDIRIEKNPIISLAVSGQATVGEGGFARIVLIDDQAREYLVFSAEYPFTGTLDFKGSCQETCVLDPVKPAKLSIELSSNATITLNEALSLGEKGVLQPDVRTKGVAATRKELKTRQNATIVEMLNSKNRETEKHWLAGETDVALLPYAEQKKLFGGTLPALEGFLNYKGGYFTMTPPSSASKLDDEMRTPSEAAPALATESPSSTTELGIPAQSDTTTTAIREGGMPENQQTKAGPFSFDWRNRHGQNWVTPARKQQGCWVSDHMDYTLNYSDCINQGYRWISCGSCWAMAANATVETLVNIYFNNNLQVDLSEQQVLDCASGGCGGGYPVEALDFAINNGVNDEICYPYIAQDGTCAPCANWQQKKWGIAGEELVSNDPLTLKSRIIEDGPVVASFRQWRHSMAVVGFGEISAGCYSTTMSGGCNIEIPEEDPLIGTTYWIIKNSYGPGWGEGGFAKMILPASAFSVIDGPIAPVIAPTNNPQSVICTDRDADGWCSWGITPTKPASGCPSSCDANTTSDCNDADVAIHECPEHHICGSHPWLTGYELDHGYGEAGCCGDDVGENPVSGGCCSSPTDVITPNGVGYVFKAKLSTNGKPRGGAIGNDRLYTALKDASRVSIHRLNNDGTLTFLHEFGSQGSASGQFMNPYDVAVSGNVLVVADLGNHRVQVFELVGDNAIYRSKIGKLGTADGQFDTPAAIAIDGNLVAVSDNHNNRIELFRLNGFTLSYVGKIGTLGSENGQFNRPLGIYLQADRMYVADSNNNRIQVFAIGDGPTVEFLHSFGSVGNGDGQFNTPRDVYQSGNTIFVSDGGNNRISYFTSEEPTFAYQGSFGVTGSQNGQLDTPLSVTVRDQFVYVQDTENYRIQSFNSLSGVLICAPACADGTLYNQCSTEVSMYCRSGQLVANCQTCGCPDGHTCQADGSCLPQTCPDGTGHNQCSSTKPRVCRNGSLIDDCQQCGCDMPGICQENGSCVSPACEDGTLYDQCSTAKPLFCQNGKLISDCKRCGCVGKDRCMANGSCILSSL
jgi:hypothetical protein